ncbi:MAG: hypothetical protein AAGD32_13760 [Planctomycetota bacterium]
MPEPLFPEQETPIDPDMEVVGRRDFFMTRRADRTLTWLAAQVELQSDVKLNRSHLIRAMTLLLSQCDQELIRQIGAVKLPPRYQNGNARAQDVFERKLAAAMSRAVRLVGPMDANA